MIKWTIGLPTEAAIKLLELFENDDEVLKFLRIKSIKVLSDRQNKGYDHEYLSSKNTKSSK